MCSMYKLENMSKRSRSGPSSCSPSPSRSSSRSSPPSRSTKGLINKDVLSILQLFQNDPNLRERYQTDVARTNYILKALHDVLEELSEDSPRIDLYDKLNKKLFPPEDVKLAAAEKRRRVEQAEVNERYGSKSAGRRRTQKRPTARRRVRRRSSKARTTRRK